VQDWTSRAAQYLVGHIKRLLAHFLAADMEDLRRKAFGEGEKQGRGAGYRTGFDAGKQHGWQEGHSQGITEGYAQGQMTYRLVDERERFEPKPVDDALYGPRRLRATSTNTQRMRDEVTAAASLGIVGQPTDEQWRMILADHPATCVSAGAGSGKSTTLVLRVVFMVQHLGISLDSITVVSFTKASSLDLRQKLAKVLGHWQGRPLPMRALERTVCTFHSSLLRLVRPALPRVAIFEFLKGSSTIEADESEDDVDNAGISTKLNPQQQLLLDEAYRKAYRVDPVFREQIAKLIGCELIARRAKSAGNVHGYKDGYFTMAARREQPVMTAMAQLWANEGWSVCGVRMGPVEAFRHKGHAFHADGQVGDAGPYVLLDLPAGAGKSVQINAPGTDTQPLAVALDGRLRVFAAYCERPFVCIRTAEDLQLLTLLLNLQAPQQSPSSLDPPKFSLSLPGEIKATPIVETLYQQGSFIASLGHEVSSLLQQLPAPRREDSYEYIFATVLGRFWPNFEAVLDRNHVMTFDRAFRIATIEGAGLAVDPLQLERLRHVLIDEFQDISPLIADWLIATHARLRALDKDQDVSVMAIGDDWQSIYGWRGSSPDLFLRFGEHFRTHGDLGPAPLLRLTVNFRSIGNIVEEASRLIALVSQRDEKTCTAKRQAKSTDHGVKLHELARLGPDIDQQVPHIQRFILDQYEDAIRFEGASDDHVLVMARSNRCLAKIRSKLPKKPGLKLCTYHQAKGLEADIAIMVEDCLSGDHHPFRNAVYEASGRFPDGHTYDRSTADEAYRLAYVGVTRGKRRVHWFVPDADKRFASAVYGRSGPL
jgi:superfamily I DNA/RNA helicase